MCVSCDFPNSFSQGVYRFSLPPSFFTLVIGTLTDQSTVEPRNAWLEYTKHTAEGLELMP